MGTFWEIAAYSVDHMFSLYFYYLDFLLLPVLVLRAASVPGICIHFTFTLRGSIRYIFSSIHYLNIFI